ncbi:MAG: DUF5906 domain-containing protein [Sphingobacteriia bacterium]|nr:DUF5906 domain-containing protein [Sphingobacteriia bacterium]
MITITRKAQNDILTYSTNPAVTPVMTKQEGAQKTKGWIVKTINWNEASLTSMVKNEPYCQSVFINGEKLKSSVTEMHFFAVDFDKGETTFENYKNEKLSTFGFTAFMHTTVNHQKELREIVNGEEVVYPPRDKFRVIVPLSHPITNSQAEAIKASGIIEEIFSMNKDDIDMSFIDSNRYFKQNPDAIVYFYEKEERLSSDFLIQSTKKEEKTERTKRTKKTTFANSDVLLKHDHTEIKVTNVKQKERIFCPFCDHTKRTHLNDANAFIDINPVGTKYIFCSSEQKTYWQQACNVDLEKCKLFWNASLGCPSMVGYESASVEDNSVYYVFKNDGDFKNYCCQNNINPSIKDYLPRREIIFNPGLPSGLTDKFYNLFIETKYMRKDYSTFTRVELVELVDLLKRRTPIIAELLLNIFGEKEYVERFLNWITFLLKERKKADSAWLITSEEEGIGKDLMFNRILKPLFGEKQSQLVNGKRIAKNFNNQDMNCFLRGYNEVFSSDDKNGNTSRKEWLKDAITSRKQTIELKGKDTFEADNFMNFILFSNNESPILLDKRDRRFNVVRNIKAKKVSALKFFRGQRFLEDDIAQELDAFAEIVFTLNYDIDLVNMVIDSEAKKNIQACSSNPYEDFVKALTTGDVDYFLLDEVFKPDTAETIFDKNARSRDAIEIEQSLSNYKAIPSKYMNRIVKFHFGQETYKKTIEKLKMKGITNKPLRLSQSEVIKAYM